MAAGVRTIKTRFTGDTKNLEKASGRGRKSVGKFAKVLGGALKKAAKAGAFAVAGVAVAAATLGPKLAQQAASLELQAAKAKTVFEDQIGVVQKWAKKNAAAMGLTSRKATNLAANFADLLKPMGFTAKQATGMATDVVGLSGALSEWSGGTVDAAGVADILSKAMLGEREGLKQLGISITEADVKARLAKKGQEELTGAQLQQAKATATQELIFEKSTDAQEAYEKGSGSLSRMIATGKARLREFAQELIVKATPAIKSAAKWVKTELVPRLKDLADWARTKLVPALKDLASWFGEHLLPKLQAVAGFIGDEVVPAIAGLVKWINKNREIIPAVGIAIAALLVPAFIAWAVSATAAAIATIAAAAPIILIGVLVAALAFLIIKHWDTIKKVTLKVFGAIWSFLKGLWERVTGFIGSAVQKMKDLFLRFHPVGIIIRNWEPIWGFITDLWDRVLRFLKKIPKRIGSAFSTLGDTISAPFRAGFDAVKGFWNSTIGGKGFDIPGWVPGVGGKSFRFPKFHRGGVVPGPAGAEVPILARAGERVLTEEEQRQADGDITVNVMLSREAIAGIAKVEVSKGNRMLTRRTLAGAGRAA